MRSHRDYGLAAPTPDHFIPALYLAGLAAAAGAELDVLVEGYAYGSLSMTAYTLGVDCPPMNGPGEAGLAVPSAPGQDTNL